ncbi:Nuclear pore complex protein NUP62 [Spatholobus suberectus]|nr:Nuclear pore complex protein NUP62 [Spatholobus suberectus]
MRKKRARSNVGFLLRQFWFPLAQLILFRNDAVLGCLLFYYDAVWGNFLRCVAFWRNIRCDDTVWSSVFSFVDAIWWNVLSFNESVWSCLLSFNHSIWWNILGFNDAVWRCVNVLSSDDAVWRGVLSINDAVWWSVLNFNDAFWRSVICFNDAGLVQRPQIQRRGFGAASAASTTPFGRSVLASSCGVSSNFNGAFEERHLLRGASSASTTPFGGTASASTLFGATSSSFGGITSAATPLGGVSTSTSTAPAILSSSTSATQTSSAVVVASTSGTMSTVGTSVAAAAPKLPSEITGMTVEEIIREWNVELQERTGKFRKQANAIAEWDRRILHNCDVLLRLEIEVAKVVESQSNSERQLELIETHQLEVDKALQSMEEEAERIYKDERGLPLDDEAASTRDAMYEQSKLIEREIEHMTEQIKSIIQSLNSNQGGELDTFDGMTPLDAIV